MLRRALSSRLKLNFWGLTPNFQEAPHGYSHSMVLGGFELMS